MDWKVIGKRGLRCEREKMNVGRITRVSSSNIGGVRHLDSELWVDAYVGQVCAVQHPRT